MSQSGVVRGVPAAEVSFLRDDSVLRQLFEDSRIGFALNAVGGPFLEFNQAFRAITGYSRDELLQMDYTELTPPEFLDADRRHVATLLETGHFGPYEKDYRRKDGGRVRVRLHGLLTQGPNGERLIWSTVRDVAEESRVAAALAASEARLRSVFESMVEGVVVHARDGLIIDFNPAAMAILGLSRHELLGRTAFDPRWQAVREDGSPYLGVDHPHMVTLRTGRPVRNELMGVSGPGGELRWVSINSQPVFVPGDTAPDLVVTTFVDVTELHEARRRLRELAQHLETVRDDERHALADALHEGVAQDLFAARIQLHRLVSDTGAMPVVAEGCRGIEATLERAIRATREVARGLRPTTLGASGFMPALEDYVRDFSKLSGLDVAFEVAADFPLLGESIGLLFFRTAQEALNNVALHAHASRVIVRLLRHDGSVRMEIDDDGVGFHLEALDKAGSLGLFGIRERFQSKGGRCDVQSAPGRGTTITVAIPHDPE